MAMNEAGLSGLVFLILSGSMDWSKWKIYYGVKLRVAAFIFGLIGWFLLFVSIFGSHFEQQLLGLQTVRDQRRLQLG